VCQKLKSHFTDNITHYWGRRWPVQKVVRTWQQFALLEEQIQVFLVETGGRLAQLSYFPQSGWWQLDKM
jgi:hypothetical protein